MKKKLNNFIVSIDGPAGSGKQRIAKYIAKKFNLFHLDSGVLYRRLTLQIIHNKINQNSSLDLKEYIQSIKILSARNHPKLRTEIISKNSSKLATLGFLRNFINKQQKLIINKKLKTNKNCVIDGRDIGSKVFKDAKIKLYIDVKLEIRAKRRHKQLIELGEKSIYAAILKEIKLRDKLDKNRKNSPLVIPRGAKIIDNSFDFKSTIKKINKIINNIK